MSKEIKEFSQFVSEVERLRKVKIFADNTKDKDKARENLKKLLDFGDENTVTYTELYQLAVNLDFKLDTKIGVLDDTVDKSETIQLKFGELILDKLIEKGLFNKEDAADVTNDLSQFAEELTKKESFDND